VAGDTLNAAERKARVALMEARLIGHEPQLSSTSTQTNVRQSCTAPFHSSQRESLGCYLAEADAKEAHAVNPQWYAVYTCANHEHRVAEQFAIRDIEHFLPQYETMSRWKDRRVLLHRPLFPGYVFVHLALGNRLQVQQVPGVVHLVGFNGTPTAVPEDELLGIREVMNRGMRAKPHPFLTVGRRVRVKAGPLTGVQGILVRRKSKLRFVITVDLIMRSIAVEMDEGDLEAI